MIWFGSSAGVALTNLFPQGKSVFAWLRAGWHVALAYVIGFALLLALHGWKPDAPHRLPRPAAAHVSPDAMHRSATITSGETTWSFG
jgi:hypothetical protein